MAWVKVFIYEVDHGLCSSIIDSAGNVVLIDCGRGDTFSPVKHLAAELDVPLEELDIDMFVLSHPHGEHLADIDNLLQTNIKRLAFTPLDAYTEEELQNGNSPLGYHHLKLLETVATGLAFTRPPPPKWTFALTTDFSLDPSKARRINPDAVINNSSRIAVVSFAGVRIVFPGDMQASGWPALLSDPAFVKAASNPCIVVAPHHGIKDSYCQPFYDTLGKPFANVCSLDNGLASAQYDCEASSRGCRMHGELRHCFFTKTDGTVVVTVQENGWTIDTMYLGANDY